MRYRGGVTVTIPTYNRRQLLDKALLSLCFQSFDPGREVISVDDAANIGIQNARFSVCLFMDSAKTPD